MVKNTSPLDWKAPEWHADFGDPVAELLPLKAFSSQLMLAAPKTRIVLQTPEPGLLYLQGKLPNDLVFEAYSVSPHNAGKVRRLAIFLNPDTDREIEKYFDSPKNAVAFLTVQLLKRSTKPQATKDSSQRVRETSAEMTDRTTLDTVRAGYEQKRRAGGGEFNEVETRTFMVGNRVTASYTTRQGQYLAFIYYFTKLNGQPPSEVEMQRRFMTSPPTIHQMILTLERKGFIARTPGMARSIRVLLPKEQLPDLE